MKKQKRRLQTRILAEALFWLHFLISIAILVMGLFIPWFWVVIIIIALRLQQIILHGCIITILQYREGGIPKNMAYYQLMARRFLGYRLKKRQVKPVLYIHFGSALIITVLANVFNIRLQL